MILCNWFKRKNPQFFVDYDEGTKAVGKRHKNIQIIQHNCGRRWEDILHCMQNWPMTMVTANERMSRTSISIFNQFVNIKIFYANAEVHVLHRRTLNHSQWALEAITCSVCFCKWSRCRGGQAMSGKRKLAEITPFRRPKVFFPSSHWLNRSTQENSICHNSQTTKIASRRMRDRAWLLSCRTS